MRKGIIKITNKLIAEALKFPQDWIIEKIAPTNDPFGDETQGQSEMLVSGYDFPEVNDRGDAEDVKIIVHKKEIVYEVKRIEKR